MAIQAITIFVQGIDEAHVLDEDEARRAEQQDDDHDEEGLRCPAG